MSTGVILSEEINITMEGGGGGGTVTHNLSHKGKCPPNGLGFCTSMV